VLLILSALYGVLAVVMFGRRRHALVGLLRDGLRIPDAELTRQSGGPRAPRRGGDPDMSTLDSR